MRGDSRRLRGLIAEEIHGKGPMKFERFMELALYEPGLGYYATAGPRHGPGVDFRTSPQVGSIFARLLAHQIEECRRRLGSEGDFTIIEYGAGALDLARGIIRILAEQGAWPASSRYLCVDPHSQTEVAGGPERVSEAEALEALGQRGSVVISNEFLDALPVRRLVKRREGLHEIRVGVETNSGAGGDDDLFVDMECPLASDEAAMLEKMIPALPDGFQFEWSPRARAWMSRIGRALDRGYVITLDYGYRRNERYRPERASGTLLAYHRHRVERDLYARVGEQDLTSHVDFDDLIEAGEGAGLVCLGLTDQMRFLTALAGHLGLLEGEPGSPEAWRERLAFKELIRPGGMGTAFRVLIQATSATFGPLRGLEDPFAA